MKQYGFLLVWTTAFLVATAGCTGGGAGPEKKGRESLTQTGSSTVLPLAIAWAEEFEGADISVSGGGSSHGLNALLEGDAQLGDASRLMKSKDYEKVGCPGEDVKSDGTASAPCKGVKPEKWLISYDVLVIVVNNENSWATKLTYEQLQKIFTDDSPAVYWDEVEGLTGAPHEKIEIYAPDEASGTYDFFFEEIIADWGQDSQAANTRLDAGDGVYHPSADDNVILNAIRDNKNAIGYFGFAYYKENTEAVTPVWVGKDAGSIEEPSLANVAAYPMARPLHIYTDGIPSKGSAVGDYMAYVLSEEGQSLVPEVGYVKLDLVDEALLKEQRNRLN